MQLKSIHTFLVHPERNKDDQTDIVGSVYNVRQGKLFVLLKKIFDEAPVECEYDIKFVSSDQKNIARAAIVNFVMEPKVDNGYPIATMLQNSTPGGSGLGLLFLLFGEDGNKAKRLVISRFPAEAGILAQPKDGKLLISLIEEVFMKNAKTYKAASFDGKNTSEDFWRGQAVDKQVNYAFREVAEYWIKGFLQSEYVITAARGTERLGEAIKHVVNRTEDLRIKEEIAAAVNLSKKLDKQALSPSRILEKLNLSDEASRLILEQIPINLVHKNFKFSAEVLKRVLPYKTVFLDNGALVTAPLEDFNKVFDVTQHDKGKTSYYTIGKVIDEKLKKGN